MPMIGYKGVALRIREMILRGELPPGERLGEEALAERLGVSRTPIRQALPALAREGLLAAAGRRGYVVRSFSPQDVLDAIETRGLLEGLAARRIAEKGPTPELIRSLKDCLSQGDAILARRRFESADEQRYSEMNGRFHALIVEGAGSRIIADALARNDHVPFASASAVAFSRDSAQLLPVLNYAHRQHHAIVQALENREGARAEALMREHATPVKEVLNLKL
ncbi:MAG TPA: GntR family transcriptional regulator [Burkholderiales bacterium]|nr:GntR family transcriptional regulator [Burkholderiales bacterium]